MTVKELIKQLSTYDENVQVGYMDFEAYHSDWWVSAYDPILPIKELYVDEQSRMLVIR